MIDNCEFKITEVILVKAYEDINAKLEQFKKTHTALYRGSISGTPD